MHLSIAIVNFNTSDSLVRCINSIKTARIRSKYKIVVVDNNSTDGSVEAVTKRFPDVDVFQSTSNIGFARAVNIAFNRSKGRFFLILNPDVEVSEGAINILLDYMELHPNVALSSPKLLNSDGSLQYSCRKDYTLRTFLFRRIPLRLIFSNHRIIRTHLMMDWDHLSVLNVDWVLGAALMIRREAFPNSQVMDERFFLYFEDVDLCLQLRKQGWRVIYHPDSVMIHHHQRASATGLFSRAKFEHFKSWIKFSWKHRHEPLLHLSRNKGHG
jgi:GT2 family glycosyltransferase